MVLWEEYREADPAGYGYSRFCDLYREFERAVAGDAPASCGRRQGVRRLLGQEDRHRRSGDRRGARRRDLRRGAGRFQLHLRRSDLDADVAGLDRGACAHVPVLRRGAGLGRARQSQERRQQGLVLRSRDQSQLRHDGDALRRRHLPARPYRPRDKAKVEPASALPRAIFSGGCGIRRSSRSPRPIAPLRSCSNA